MNGLQIATPDAPKIRPAFTVRKLDGKRKFLLWSFDSKGKKVAKEVEEDAGFMVRFAKGHSIRVRTEADLKRLGFDRTIPLVDMNHDGFVMGAIPNDILEDAE